MIGWLRRMRHAVPGKVFAKTGTSTPDTVKAVMGGRLFPAHVATVGYDYDYHPGYDLDMDEGDDILSPMAGCVIRQHRGHYGFEDAEQMDDWVADADGGASPATFTRVAPSTLQIVGTRGGAGTFPNVAKFATAFERFAINDGNWEFRIKLTPAVLAAGAFGFAVIDYDTGQYVGMEYNGSIVTCLGARSGGAVGSHGTTGAVTTEPYLRMSLFSTTLAWDISADAETWTNVDSEAMPTFTSTTTQKFVPILYWRSTDTNATPVTIDIDAANFYDGNGIDRFGNFLIVANETEKIVIPHFRMFYVRLGAVVRAGQRLGKVGLTGFDATSGNINFPHVHFEYAPNTSPIYVRTESTNSLAPGIMPRANVSNNVTVTRSTATDPDGVTCWKLAISVARADQDFDMNEISLTGNTTSRTVNLNTRAGLNADLDVPKEAGVYIVPGAFNAASSAYTVDYYFSKAVVGNTFVSAFVKDTAGTSLWSE